MTTVTFVTLRTAWGNGRALYEVKRGGIRPRPSLLEGYIDLNDLGTVTVDRFIVDRDGPRGTHVCYGCVEAFYATPEAPAASTVWPSHVCDCRAARTAEVQE